MVSSKNEGGSPRPPYDQGKVKTETVDVYDMVRRYRELSSYIEQLDSELKKLLFELLELQQAKNKIEAVPQIHNCLEHAEETWILHEDEDLVFEEPVVSCNLCGGDITSEFYEFIDIEPEDHNKEETA